MTGRRTLIPILVLLAMLAGALSLLSGPGASAQSGDEETQAEQTAPEEAVDDGTQATLELTIWQGVELPLAFWISSRADEDDEWSRAEVEMALQEGGGWRTGDLTVTAGDHDFELRLWHDPAETDEDADEVWLSARLAGELWSDYGTQQVTLDQVSESGDWNYGNLSLALPLRSPAEPTEDPDAIVFAVCPPEDQTKTYAHVYIWQRKTALDNFWITSRTASNQKWKTIKLSLALNEDETWNTADLTIAGRRGEIDLRLWQDAGDQRNVWLSARSSGAGWDDYGTKQWSLDRTSSSGRYWYRLRTVTLAVPDNEASEPGSSIPNWASWDCNNAPIANAGEDQTVNAGSTVTLDGSESSDPDGDTLTYLWTGPDDIELTNADTDTATFTTTTEQIGQTLAFTLTVTDPGGKSGADDIEITVQQAQVFFGGAPIGGGTPTPSPGQQDNEAPTAHAGPDQIAAPGATVTLDGSQSSDPEQESPGLSYSWVRRAGAAGGTYDGNTSISPGNTVNPTFTMPSDATPGETLIFTLTVTDPSGAKSTNTDTNTVTITTNTPPTANAGADQTVGVGSTVQLNGGSSSDPDPNDTSSFSWAQTGGSYTGTVTLTGPTTATPSFEVPSAARGLTITFTLTVTDSHDQTGTDDVEVTVTANQPPATPSPSASPTSGIPGASVDLTADEVDDPDTGDNVSYKWTKDSGSTYAGSISFADSTARNTSFSVPSDATKDQTIVLKLTASDDQTPSASSSATVTFTVTAELTTDSVTANGVRLKLVGWSSKAWWYKSATAGQTTCESAGTSATAIVTGLTPGTAYVFTAYSDNQCLSALDAAPSFTTPPKLTASKVTTTGATLTLAGHTAQWWYKANEDPHKTCQGPVPANTATKTLTGLTEGTWYTYAAYSATDCPGASLLALSNTFKTGVSLTASGVTATGATLTIAGHTAQWWYNATTGPHSDCQGPVAANTATKTLTGLTPGTSYTYSAYSASGCARANQLATASSFTTPAQLTTSNPTARGVTLNLAGHSGAWWYKSTTSGKTDCTSAGTGASANVTGLTPNTAYTFTAYSNNNCANAIDAAPEFTTPVELTASGETATTVTLNLAGHTGDWWYKATTGPDNTCRGTVAAGTNSFPVLFLTPGASYTYSAYSATGCDDDDLLATATFTTKSPVLTSSNVTKNSATLSLGNWDGAKDPTWAYKSATAGKTTCTVATAGSTQATVTGLTAGTAYIFTAYNYNCTTVLDAAPSFTTAHAPTVSFSNANVTAGNTATLSVTAGHTGSGTISSYTWSVTGKSTGAPDASLTSTTTTTATTGLVVPSSAWKASPHHTYTVKVRATDSAGEWTEASATLTVNNRAPVADARASKAYALYPQRVDLNGLSSRDPDYNPLTDPVPTWSYSWAKTGGTYTGDITINYASSSTPNFTVPNEASIGDTIIITLTLGDGDGGTDTDSVTINVNAAPQESNNPPVANPGARVQYFRMTPANKNNPVVSLDGSGSSDPDGDTLIYAWSPSGAGTCHASITLTNASSAKPSFQWPSACAVGTSIGLRLTVTDRAKNGLSDTEDIQVWRRDGVPTVTITGGNITEYKRSDSTARSFTVSGSASDDPDGDTLDYEWDLNKAGWTGRKPCPTPSEPNKTCPDPTQLPAGFSISPTGAQTTLGNLTVTLGSSVVAATDYSITLRAGNGYATVNLTIKNNTAPGTPTLSPTSLSGRQGQTYGLRASANDSDSGQTLSYQWNVSTSCVAYLTFSSPNEAATDLTIAPTAPDNATCNVKAKVTDGYGGESEATLIVTIAP